jgi:tumor protein p53-inducible protein 3
MRAIVVREEQLVIEEIPEPVLQDGDLLVQVRAAGVNRADLLQRLGRYAPPPGEPATIGLEIAGEVLEPAQRRGERVMALLAGGGYAERARVPAAQAMPIPQRLDFIEAAAVPEAFLTAYLNLVTLGGLARDQVVIVHAAASGVGTAALQLCRGVASTVLATASPAKLDACRALGATHVLARAEVPNGLAAAVQAAAGRKADLILDLVGGSYLEANIAALGLHGRLCCISTMGGAKGTLDLGALLQRRLSVLGSTLRTRSARQKAKLVSDFTRQALPRFDRRESPGGEADLRPVLAATFPLREAMQAHEALQRGDLIGKIVLEI